VKRRRLRIVRALIAASEEGFRAVVDDLLQDAEIREVDVAV